MTEEELIEKVLPVYNPEAYGIDSVLKPKAAIEVMLKNEEQQDEALDHLWKYYIFTRDFWNYELGKVPEREEAKEVKMTMPQHTNDIGCSMQEWQKKLNK